MKRLNNEILIAAENIGVTATAIPELVREGVPQEVFFALPFTAKVPQGIVVFHEGFLAKS